MRIKTFKEFLSEDIIKGGLADNKDVQDISKLHGVSISQIESELEKGIKVEMEHTDDKELSREIALDHLVEMPDYYTKLDKIDPH